MKRTVVIFLTAVLVLTTFDKAKASKKGKRNHHPSNFTFSLGSIHAGENELANDLGDERKSSFLIKEYNDGIRSNFGPVGEAGLSSATRRLRWSSRPTASTGVCTEQDKYSLWYEFYAKEHTKFCLQCFCGGGGAVGLDPICQGGSYKNCTDVNLEAINVKEYWSSRVGGGTGVCNAGEKYSDYYTFHQTGRWKTCFKCSCQDEGSPPICDPAQNGDKDCTRYKLAPQISGHHTSRPGGPGSACKKSEEGLSWHWYHWKDGELICAQCSCAEGSAGKSASCPKEGDYYGCVTDQLIPPERQHYNLAQADGTGGGGGGWGGGPGSGPGWGGGQPGSGGWVGYPGGPWGGSGGGGGWVKPPSGYPGPVGGGGGWGSGPNPGWGSSGGGGGGFYPGASGGTWQWYPAQGGGWVPGCTKCSIKIDARRRRRKLEHGESETLTASPSPSSSILI